MIYEVKVQHKKVMDDGSEKSVKESYVVAEAEGFADAEQQAFEYMEGVGFDEADVIAVKRSNVKEIANKSKGENTLWVAELMDVFLEDDGTEKQLKYKIFLFAKTFDAAKLFITDYSAQGYGMTLVSLKLTNHVDVIGG